MPSASAFLEDEAEAPSAAKFLDEAEKPAIGHGLSASKFLSDVEPLENKRPLAGRAADAASTLIGGAQGEAEFAQNPVSGIARGVGYNPQKPLVRVDLPPKEETTPIGEGVGKFVKGLIEGGTSPEGIGEMLEYPKMLTDMITAAPAQFGKFKDAVKNKDVAGATEAFLNGTAMLAPAVTHGIESVPKDVTIPRTGRSLDIPKGATPKAPPAVIKAVKDAAPILPKAAEAAATQILKTQPAAESLPHPRCCA